MNLRIAFTSLALLFSQPERAGYKLFKIEDLNHFVRMVRGCAYLQGYAESARGNGHREIADGVTDLAARYGCPEILKQVNESEITNKDGK